MGAILTYIHLILSLTGIRVCSITVDATHSDQIRNHITELYMHYLMCMARVCPTQGAPSAHTPDPCPASTPLGPASLPLPVGAPPAMHGSAPSQGGAAHSCRGSAPTQGGTTLATTGSAPTQGGATLPYMTKTAFTPETCSGWISEGLLHHSGRHPYLPPTSTN